MDEQNKIALSAYYSKRIKDQNMRLICIEGNIGVGKSTLTKALSDLIGARAMYEPVGENPYLELFYHNPKRYALEMQFWLMSQRFRMHEDAINHIWTTGQSVIMDRSIYGDWIFAKKNWLDGNIESIGYASYQKHREVMNQKLLIPHIVLWLKAHPQTCQERISTRGRNCEKSIPLEYLKGLHELHCELMEEMRKRGSKVIILDWDVPYSDIHEIIEKLEINPRNLKFQGIPSEIHA
jgi:deoxyadenosine/deoxycytidine kinase